MGVSLSGMASGVDTNSIVDQLMAIERQSTTRIQTREYNVSGLQSALKNVASKLATLKSAAQALGSESNWKPTQTVESSDSRIVVAQTGGAGIGGHSLQVNRLASSMQRGYSLPGGTAGTLTITANADSTNTMTIAVAADATPQQIADAINAKSTGPVVAAVVKNSSGEDRLVLSSRKTGSESDFSVSGGLLADDATYTTPDVSKLDAEYSLDGGAVQTSKTNVLENIVPGLRMTLKGVTSSPAAITVTEPTLDRNAVKDKIKAFVNAYNAVVDTARSEITEKPDSTGATDALTAGQGQLYGDTGMNSMLSALRRQMSAIVSDAGINDLADLGIGIPASSGGASQDAKDGKLAIDDTKLSAALDSDWTAVKSFFSGFSKKVSDYVDTQTGGSGVIDGRLASADRTMKTLTSQMDDMNTRLDAKETRLKAQFAAMETAMQNSQTQQAWLQGQLAGLPTWG
jgi:flagellar hook-associated protein 2